MARKKKSATSVKINFKGVESRRTPPEGDYILEVLEVTSGKSGAGNDQLEWVFEIAKGEYKGTKVYFYTGLSEKQLWSLHALLTALGEDVPEDEMDIDLSELVGKECVGVLTHETYNGKKRHKMTDFDSVENYSGGADEEEEEEKPAKGKKAAGKKSKAKEKVAKSDVEDMDRDDLEALIEEHSLDVDADDKKLKKDDKLLAAVLAALEEEELLEEEEEEKPAKGKKGKSKSKDEDDDEEEKPAKGKKSKGKAKAKKLDKSDVEDMDEDELQELIDEHDLDVDLDDYKKLPKKVAAVVEALEEADLLEDDD